MTGWIILGVVLALILLFLFSNNRFNRFVFLILIHHSSGNEIIKNGLVDKSYSFSIFIKHLCFRT